MKADAVGNQSVSFVNGFTLIEVLIALAIFSIGFLAMGALQTGALMQTGEIGRKTEAWAVLSDHVELLKAVPFYANDNHVDDDGDGTIDEIDELFDIDPGEAKVYPLASGDHSADRVNGRYTVHWQVVDDEPIGEQDNRWSSSPAKITVSKTITVTVTEAGGDAVADALASVEFVKVWAADSGAIP